LKELISQSEASSEDPVSRIKSRLDLYNSCLKELDQLIPQYEPDIASFAKLKTLICDSSSQSIIDYRDSQMTVIL